MDPKILLFESFDRSLNGEEQQVLDQALAQDPALRLEKEQLETIRKGLSGLQLSPKLGFADGVMERIGTNPAGGWVHQMSSWFPQIAAALLLATSLSLGSIYWSAGDLDTNTLIGYEELQPEEAQYVLEN